MNKGLEALKSMWLYIDEPTKRKFALQDYKIIEKELKEYETEHTLRIRLENINYELVREKQENEKELKRLEELEKAFKALSKDDEKAKKELSKEIENIKIIKETLNLKVYKNKLGQCFLEGTNILIPIEQDKYDLLKEVLL